VIQKPALGLIATASLISSGNAFVVKPSAHQSNKGSPFSNQAVQQGRLSLISDAQSPELRGSRGGVSLLKDTGCRQPTALNCRFFKFDTNSTNTDELSDEETVTEPDKKDNRPKPQSPLEKFMKDVESGVRQMSDNYNQALKDNGLIPSGNYTQPKKNKITFDDVAGVDHEKAELYEVVDFLKKPEKYTRLGARLPKGVLLEGPPGTGKTLLAKATAGEANVPFHPAKGSDFVEMFVGLGAQRVRNIFKKAAQKAPCIIFIDEFDAVGGKRSGGEPGRSEERDQTLNALLAEMDGFESDRGIVVIATTNRRDILDSAVLRPGRFDRIVNVNLPDVKGREAILNVHTRNKPLAKEVDLKRVSERSLGFSGADLENLMNEAAMLSARDNLDEIPMAKIDEAYEKISFGLEKTNREMPEKRKRLVAYHEAGHALVAAKLSNFDDVLKVSIVPRGPAGGLTWFKPDAEQVESGLYSREYLKNQLAVGLAGRLAEEVVFGKDEVTTGAAGDFIQVRNIAEQMIKSWGMGDLPLRNYETAGSMFNFPSSDAQKIEKEVDKLVLEAEKTARKILTENRDSLNNVADTLIKEETLDEKGFLDALKGTNGDTANPTQKYINDISKLLHPAFRKNL